MTEEKLLYILSHDWGDGSFGMDVIASGQQIYSAIEETPADVRARIMIFLETLRNEVVELLDTPIKFEPDPPIGDEIDKAIDGLRIDESPSEELTSSEYEAQLRSLEKPVVPFNQTIKQLPAQPTSVAHRKA